MLATSDGCSRSGGPSFVSSISHNLCMQVPGAGIMSSSGTKAGRPLYFHSCTSGSFLNIHRFFLLLAPHLPHSLPRLLCPRPHSFHLCRYPPRLLDMVFHGFVVSSGIGFHCHSFTVIQVIVLWMDDIGI